MSKKQSQTAKALETISNQVKADKAPKPIYTPTQTIEMLTEKMSAENATLTKDVLTTVLAEMADESNSRIQIGLNLLKLQIPLGSDFTRVLEKFAEAVNRGVASLWRYIGLAKVASFEFQANPVARTALFRIWDCRGGYDEANGELKPVVAKCLKIHPLPESKDSATCEVWARRFVDEFNGLVKASRSPRTAADKVEQIQKRHKAILKAFTSFIDKLSKPTSAELLSDILATAYNTLGGVEVDKALVMAKDKAKHARIESNKLRETEASEQAANVQ